MAESRGSNPRERTYGLCENTNRLRHLTGSMDESNLSDLEDALHQKGYLNLTYKPDGDTPSISGGVNDVDFTDVEKSVPEGDDTGPFKTFDSPEDAIPTDIAELCETYGVTPQVLGHGPNRLHLYISE